MCNIKLELLLLATSLISTFLPRVRPKAKLLGFDITKLLSICEPKKSPGIYQPVKTFCSDPTLEGDFCPELRKNTIHYDCRTQRSQEADSLAICKLFL